MKAGGSICTIVKKITINWPALSQTRSNFLIYIMLKWRYSLVLKPPRNLIIHKYCGILENIRVTRSPPIV